MSTRKVYFLKRGENSIEKGKSKNKECDEMKGVWGLYLLIKLYVRE